MNDENLLNLFIDNLRKFFFPEELIALDNALSKTELLSLLIIDRHGEIIMSQIADFIRVPLSTATGIIDRLVKQGYLKRERSETDRRIVTIQLTLKGRQIIEEFKDKISDYITLIEKALTNEEKASLYNLIIKIMEAIQQKDSQVLEKFLETNTGNKIKPIPID